MRPRSTFRVAGTSAAPTVPSAPAMPAARQRAPTDAVHPLESLNSSRPRRSYTFPWGAARSVPDSDKSQIPPRTMRFATPSHPPSFAPPHHPSSRVGMRPMLCGRPPSTSRPIRDRGKTSPRPGMSHRPSPAARVGCRPIAAGLGPTFADRLLGDAVDNLGLGPVAASWRPGHPK